MALNPIQTKINRHNILINISRQQTVKTYEYFKKQQLFLFIY